ncbi:hypothetical protein JCM8547_007689 [Rhodosporidiobolus lusitaniae]
MLSSAWNHLRDYVDSSIAALVPPAVQSSLFSQPPPPPLPPVDPFPPLPTELVLRILSFTLPSPSYSSARARARKLKRLALLNKDFARWATLELRTDVVLSTTDSARWFAGLARRKGPAWAGAVRTLRLGSAEPLQAGMDGREESVDRIWRGEGVGKLVRDLMKLCENAEELWLCGIGGIEVGQLATGKNLRKLSIGETRVVPSTTLHENPSESAFVLPHLHSLYLKSVIFTGPSLSDFLSPTSLPALRTLDYLSVHQSLVSPLVHPRGGQNGGGGLSAINGNGGGPANLVNMTASLAALSAPSASSASSSTLSAHPILTVAPFLTSLSLGPHSTRTLPLSDLADGGFAVHFPLLSSLSAPWSLLTSPSLSPADYPPTLRALRVGTGNRPEPSGMVPADMARNMQSEHELLEARAMSVFQHAAITSPTISSSSSEERTRTLTLPTLEHRWARFLPPPSSSTSPSPSASSRSPSHSRTGAERLADKAVASAALVSGQVSRPATPVLEGAREERREREERERTKRVLLPAGLGEGEERGGDGGGGGEVKGVWVEVEYEREEEEQESRDGVFELVGERWRERLGRRVDP